MKRIISAITALSMVMSMICTTAFAVDDTAALGQNEFVYTDKTLQTYDNIATTELNKSDSGISIMTTSTSDDELETVSLGKIEAKSNPLVSVNGNVNNNTIDDVLDCYSVSAFSGPVSSSYKYEIVDELVVLLTDLSYGDRLVMIITDSNDNEIASGVIDGRKTKGAYISFPVDNIGKYKIYIGLASFFDEGTDDNTDVSYTLQVASKYVRDTQQFYARTTSIKFSGNEDWSTAGSMYISKSDVPNSAIVDSMFINGTLTDTKTGKPGYVSIVRLQNGTQEISGNCPSTMENLDRFNIPLAGSWKIIYRPSNYAYDPHVLTNFSAKIDYTYDILEG